MVVVVARGGRDAPAGLVGSWRLIEVARVVRRVEGCLLTRAHFGLKGQRTHKEWTSVSVSVVMCWHSRCFDPNIDTRV